MLEITKQCKSKPIGSCMRLFQQRGLRSVSIEEIVRETSWSKKEIYQNFTNKEGLIKEVLAVDLHELAHTISEIQNTSENAIYELIQMNHYYRDKFAQINPVMFFDLQKYYSSIAKEYEQDRCAINSEFFSKNIRRGISEQLYRNDFDEDLVHKLWFRKIELVKEVIFFESNGQDVCKLAQEITELHLRSIATPEGVEFINKNFRPKLRS